MALDASAIRARIDHPVIDGDGHLVEFLPLVRDFMVELGGESLGAGLDRLLAGPGLGLAREVGRLDVAVGTRPRPEAAEEVGPEVGELLEHPVELGDGAAIGSGARPQSTSAARSGLPAGGRASGCGT